jgi:hypothetical protein
MTILKERLHGFTVGTDGKLYYWCYPGKELYMPELKGVIPDNVLINGANAVELYVDDLVQKAIAKTQAEHRERMLALQKVRVDVEVTHENFLLKGLLTHTSYGGVAKWDIHLLQPLEFEGLGTLYGNRYSHTPPGQELVEDFKPTNYALHQAKKELVQIYKRRRHERTFPLSHKVLRELKLKNGEA